MTIVLQYVILDKIIFINWILHFVMQNMHIKQKITALPIM
jgi:hypothetical protein